MHGVVTKIFMNKYKKEGAKVGRLASPGDFENRGSSSVVARNRLTENRMGREPRKLRREMQRALHAKLKTQNSLH